MECLQIFKGDDYDSPAVVYIESYSRGEWNFIRLDNYERGETNTEKSFEEFNVYKIQDIIDSWKLRKDEETLNRKIEKEVEKRLKEESSNSYKNTSYRNRNNGTKGYSSSGGDGTDLLVTAACFGAFD